MIARPEDFLIYQIIVITVAKVPDLANESILIPIREKASAVATMADNRCILVIDCKQPLTGGASASRVLNNKTETIEKNRRADSGSERQGSNCNGKCEAIAAAVRPEEVELSVQG